MTIGVQLSSFAPLMKDAAGLENVLAFLKSISCPVTQLQWIDKSVPAETVAYLARKYSVRTLGVQEKTALLLGDLPYHTRLAALCDEPELCFSGIPNGDAAALSRALSSAALPVSYHPVKADFTGAVNDLLAGNPLLQIVADVCQLHDAGIDPAAFILRYAGHIRAVHFKDRNFSGNICPVGTGAIDFESAFSACEKAGVKYILVEQETWQNAFAEIGQGFEYVTRLANRR